MTKALLIEAARIETWDLIDKVSRVVKASGGNQIVICDRHVGSAFAYNAAAGIPEWITSMLQLQHAHRVKPDLTFFLKISPEKAMERIQSRGEPLAAVDTLEIQQKVHEGYKSWINLMNDGIPRGHQPVQVIKVGDKSTDQLVDEAMAHLRFRNLL